MLPTHHFKMSAGDNLPFEIVSYKEMGKKTKALSGADYPHRHTFYEILYYTGGDGTHIIDFEPYRHTAPVVYFISPGQVHFWKLMCPLEGYALVLKEDFLLMTDSGQGKFHEFHFFHGVNDNPFLYLNKMQAAIIDTHIQSIWNEYKTAGFSRASVLRAQVHILVVQLQRMYNLNENMEDKRYRKSILVRKFVKLVSQCFIHQRSVQYYADSLSITVAHLSDTVKNITGASPGQIIRKEVVLEAKRLLAHTDLDVAEIGYRLTFEDPSYFGRFFKRETGIRPRVFREQIQREYHYSH